MMPKPVKHFDFLRKDIKMSEYYIALYRAYKRYYVIVVRRDTYGIACIKLKNALTAVMLLKELQVTISNDYFCLNDVIIENKKPYWIIVKKLFNRMFWKRVKNCGVIFLGEVGRLVEEKVNEFVENP